MRLIISSASISLVLMSVSSFASAGTPKTAEAEIVNTKGEKIGSASLIQTKDGLKVAIQASHLPPGEHGIHFHETGTCKSPHFKSAGGHFSPTHKQHGLKSARGPHSGDLPNLKVNSDGTAMTEMTTKRVTLMPGNNSLLKEGSTSIIIHDKQDDQMTDPSGGSGDRIACGVIEDTSHSS
jgi:Cu-Zn family superoxide dismutase